MIRTKHIFRQDADCLRYAQLGDTAVRVVTIRHLIDKFSLDALIVPLNKPDLLPLWYEVFGKNRIILDSNAIPNDYLDARISAPTSLDWNYGNAAWNVFEAVMWENGFFETKELTITPPVVFPCDHKAAAAMIYPVEHTDGNRIYDSQWWIQTCQSLRDLGYRLHHLGNTHHPKLKQFYSQIEFDQLFEPTIDGIKQCAACSSVAIGGSTGPTWTLLLSDIPQVVLESRQSPHGYWNFDRCQQVLRKKLRILPTLESMLTSQLV